MTTTFKVDKNIVSKILESLFMMFVFVGDTAVDMLRKLKTGNISGSWCILFKSI